MLLVGDLFYDEDVGNKVIDFMKTFVSTECANKKIVFLGDPGTQVNNQSQNLTSIKL